MPVVSVVIPSFRGGAFLRDAIASVQSQTLQDWELIIVLDGCEDDLSEIEQSDDRVRVFRQKNRGECVSRNVGIGHARSTLIALLDDDDRMLPDRLQAQVEVMKDESIGVCHTQYRVIDEFGLITGMGESKESQYRDFLRADGLILISTAMIRRELIQDVGGFNPLFLLSGDLDLLYRIARESSFFFLPEVLTEYRRHGSNLSIPVSGGDQLKLILRQHLISAEARGETDNVRAIRHGMPRVPAGRAARAIRYAREARSRKNYVGMFGALGLALVLAPRVTVHLSLKQARKELPGIRSLASAVRTRVKPSHGR
jgi:glycosyltransferase involved in cell wall biosynthesis